MKEKLVIILVVIILFLGVGFGMNRVSTQFHPWGNWALGALAFVVIAIIGAAWWDAASKGVTNWDDYRKQIDKK